MFGLFSIFSCQSKSLGDSSNLRACYGVLRFIMESGAKGCEVVVSGKLRGQRAKSMKFVDGLMIHSGEPINDYVDTAVRHVLLRQGKSYFMAFMRVFTIRAHTMRVDNIISCVCPQRACNTISPSPKRIYVGSILRSIVTFYTRVFERC